MSSNALSFPPGQLQAKYKHAAFFWSDGRLVRGERGREALERHVNSPATRRIKGTFRGRPVVHYIDPVSALDVMFTPAGVFVSGWRLNARQLRHVFENGTL